MKLFLLVALFLIGHPLFAEPIVVKSGDHPSFTRLVLYTPKNLEWTVTADGRQSKIEFEDWSEGFDVSGIFRRIDKQRVSSVAATATSLVIVFGCNCEMTTTRTEDGYLSLDIKETSEIRPSPKPRAERTVQIEISPDLPSVLDWPVLFKTAQEESMLVLNLERNLERHSLSFEEKLVEQISRSATLKHLEPAADQSLSRHDRTPGDDSDDRLTALTDLSERLRFSDAATTKLTPREVEISGCQASDELAVSKWGGNGDFASELARFRSGLFSEFDELNLITLKQIVQLYIHHGLIPEALDIIERNEGVPDRSVLRSVASLFDPENVHSSDLGGYIDCEGESGFWGFLGHEPDDVISDNSIENVVFIFQRLPEHLKELTANSLIEKLQILDQHTAAGIVRNSRGQTTDYVAEQAEQIPLRVDLKTLKSAELEKLLKNSDEQSPEALAILMERAVLSRSPMDDARLELAQSYTQQLNGSDIAMSLNSSLIVGMAQAGRGSDAFDLFTANLEKIPNKLGKTTRGLFNEYVLSADIELLSQLSIVLDTFNLLVEVTDEQRLSGARFALEAGLPQIALVLLGISQIPEDAKSVYAEILSDLGRYEEAEKLVGGNPEIAVGKKLTARLLQTDPSGAWVSRDRLTVSSNDTTAWITGNWSEIKNDQIRLDVAEIARDVKALPLGSDKPIQSARDAFSQSRNTREAIGNLLQTRQQFSEN